jgi:hypothetical protein
MEELNKCGGGKKSDSQLEGENAYIYYNSPSSNNNAPNPFKLS